MKNCCIEGCKASKKDVTFFEFPTSRLLRKRWLDAINPSVKLALDALVCSQHFSVEDYENVRGKTRLKGKVVPTIFKNQAQNSKDPQNDPLGLPDNTDNQESKNNDSHNGKIDNDNEKVDNHSEKVDNHNEKISNDTNSSKDATENGHNGKTDNHNVDNDSRTVDNDNEKVDNDNKVVDNDNIIVDNDNRVVDNDNIMVDNDNGKVDNEKVGQKRVAVKAVSKRVKKKWVPMRERVKIKGDSSDDSSSQDSVNSDLPMPPVLEDLEEHLPNYHIANMKTERQVAAMLDTIDPVDETVEEVEELVVEPHVPVFIELSVGQDNTVGSSEANDCLMVMESVQCDVDPTLLLQARAEEEACAEHIDLDDDDDDEPVLQPIEPKKPSDPISLLTSSDEDDVILQEPHIDTLSVSDETDEDDLPLLKLIKRKKPKKSKNKKPEAMKSILTGVTDFYCMYCQRISLDRSSHDRHVKVHLKKLDEQSQGTTRVYQICKECGYTTSSKSQLLRHQRKHVNEKRYKCPLCSYRSKYNMSLMYHLKTHHLDSNVYNCGACGLQCDSKEILVDHQSSCFELSERFPCGVCGYEARTKRALKIHRNNLHKHRA